MAVLSAFLVCAASLLSTSTTAETADPAIPSAARSTSGPHASAELALLAEINSARCDPRGYAKTLRDQRRYYHDQTFEPPGEDALETAEGAAALDDAIADLETRAPAPALAADDAIAQAALRLVADQGRTGALGHVDSANGTLRDRLEGAGVWAMSMEEAISYGPTDPRAVVRELIIDDGVRDRAHRKAIFDSTMTRAGYACGAHAGWGWMCVIDFTSDAMAHPPKAALARPHAGANAPRPQETASSR